MEAVFARLGVKHEARNVGMGGLGTLQTGLAAASILGPHVDVIMWDSGMYSPLERFGVGKDTRGPNSGRGRGKRTLL
jgi:hypothetical protein